MINNYEKVCHLVKVAYTRKPSRPSLNQQHTHTYIHTYIYIYAYTYIYIYIYDSQIVHHNSCFNLLILHNNSFDNQGSEINKNIFLRFDIMSFTKIDRQTDRHGYRYIDIDR